MTVWPELRASYRGLVGRDLAKAQLHEFLEHTWWYMINSSDDAMQKREAFTKALRGEVVEGGEFRDTARSMIDTGALEAFEQERTTRV